MKKNSAFTLAEILIAIAIIGIAATAVMNNIKGFTNNANKIAFKKCYNHMVATLNDMQNDKNAYPDLPTSETDTTLLGFANHYKYSDSSVGTFDAKKFYTEFKNRTLGTSKDVVNNTTNKKYGFEAKDGSFWYFEYQSSNQGKAPYLVYRIIFDVNGLYKGQNCIYKINESKDVDTTCKDPDRFSFYISKNGDIHIDTTKGFGDTGDTATTTQADYLKDNEFLGGSN